MNLVLFRSVTGESGEPRPVQVSTSSYSGQYWQNLVNLVLFRSVPAESGEPRPVQVSTGRVW